MATLNQVPSLYDALTPLTPYLGEYWLDSGALLGAMRDGRLMSWDSDIDLGIWDAGLPGIIGNIPTLTAQGWKVSTRSYRGRVYGLTAKRKGDQNGRPIHIHVFYRKKDIAWSPQTVTYYPAKRENLVVGFANLPRTRNWLNRVREQARLRGRGTIVERVLRNAVAFPIWAAFVTIRNLFERQYWATVPPISALYTIYTWTIPAHHFETLDSVNIAGLSVPIPSNAEAYLSLRYGDWRKPVRDWCYWVDDGCIQPMPPEKIIDKLETSAPDHA